MILRNVEDVLPVHNRPHQGLANFGEDVYQALHPQVVQNQMVAAHGGQASIAVRKACGGSLYDETGTEYLPTANLPASFPKLKTMHIRAGLSHYEESVSQMEQPDGWPAMQQELDITLEVVRGLGGSYACIPLNTFPRCRNLTVRALHDGPHPHILDMCFINGLRNLHTVHFSLPKSMVIFYSHDSLKPYDPAVGAANTGKTPHAFTADNTITWTKTLAAANPQLKQVTFLVRNNFGPGKAGTWWIMDVKRKNGTIKVKGRERKTDADGKWIDG